MFIVKFLKNTEKSLFSFLIQGNVNASPLTSPPTLQPSLLTLLRTAAPPLGPCDYSPMLPQASEPQQMLLPPWIALPALVCIFLFTFSDSALLSLFPQHITQTCKWPRSLCPDSEKGRLTHLGCCGVLPLDPKAALVLALSSPQFPILPTASELNRESPAPLSLVIRGWHFATFPCCDDWQ